MQQEPLLAMADQLVEHLDNEDVQEWSGIVSTITVSLFHILIAQK